MHGCTDLGMAATPAERTTRRTSLLLDLWMVGHELSALLDEALACSGLSADDFGLYSLLKGWGPVTPSQISRWTGMRPTTVSLALKRLNGRGHGDQTPNPQDGRSYLVGLNAAGEAAHSAAAALFLTGMERFRSGWPLRSRRPHDGPADRCRAPIRARSRRPPLLPCRRRPSRARRFPDLSGYAAGRGTGGADPPVHRLHPEPTGLSPSTADRPTPT